MPVYAPSDVRAVTVPEHFGGCGTPHEAPVLEPGERWALDCFLCEDALTKPPLLSHGWSSQIDGVALTPDERKFLESQEKEGSAATAMMVRQLGDTLAQAMRQGYAGASGVPVAQPQFVQPSAADITAALKSMPRDELADLIKLAGLGDVSDPMVPDLSARDEAPTTKKTAATRKTAV